MKVSILCALLVAMAAAENAFLDMTVAGLANYMGLTTERQSKSKFQTVKD